MSITTVTLLSSLWVPFYKDMKNEMPKIPNSNHKLLKKGTKLVLSAATFGVVAAGSFQGVNYVVDNYNKQNTTV